MLKSEGAREVCLFGSGGLRGDGSIGELSPFHDMSQGTVIVDLP